MPPSIGYKKILGKLKKNAAFRKQIEKLKDPLKPREGKKTDEAHPAIHPTGLVPKGLGRDYQKLYELIVYRFISVFGENGVLKTIEMDIGGQNSVSAEENGKNGVERTLSLPKVENDEFPKIKGDCLDAQTTRRKRN